MYRMFLFSLFMFVFFQISLFFQLICGIKIKQSAIFKTNECPRIGIWTNLCYLIIFPDIVDWLAHVWYCPGLEEKGLYCFTHVCPSACAFVCLSRILFALPSDKILCKALRAFLKVLFRINQVRIPFFLHCCLLLVFTFETGKPLRAIEITVFLIIQ